MVGFPFAIVQKPTSNHALKLSDSSMSSFDTALLQEISACLGTSDLRHTPFNDPVVGLDASTKNVRNSFCIGWSSAENATKGSDTNLNASVGGVVALKRTRQREKESHRKQRYQQRLKQERENLRRAEKELTGRLLQLKQAGGGENKRRDAVVSSTSTWRDFTIQQREDRVRAEEEQQRLMDAITAQASYLAKLRELLPDEAENVMEAFS